MTKQTIAKGLITAGLLASFPIAAQANHTGVYIGAALGGAALTGSNNLTLSSFFPALPATIASPFTLNFSSKSIQGDFFVGFGKRFNCFCIAIEAMGTLASLKSTDNLSTVEPGDSTLTTNTPGSFGGFVNLGYHLNPTNKLYLKLGFEARRFKLNFVNASNIYYNLNKNYNATAFVPGAGMEMEITPRFSIRTEYRIALYGKKTNQVTNPADSRNFTTIQTKPTIHYFNVGLTFKI